MKRRLLAILCLLALCLSVFAVTAAAESTGEYYQVGYSKMDINPWIDPTDHSLGIILKTDETKGIPVSGYDNAENRIATSMIDDNGDGAIDENDGLFTTCTIVVDPNGKMLVFFTLDAISAYSEIVTAVRTKVVEEITALGGNITTDRIMVTGSHSHTGPMMDSLNDDTTDTLRCQYYDYIISQMTAAAVNAYNDKANATMSRREIDVSEEYGYQLNWVRHINIPYTVQDVYDYKSSWYGTDKTETLATGSAVYGSNFGFISGTKTLAQETISGSTISNKGTITTQLVVDTANRTHVSEADDTLQMLSFAFEDEAKEPIVLLNWRAHPDNIGGYYISSDYIGALRYRLEENKTKFGGASDYRVGFWQGASGNINVHSALTTEEPWVTSTNPAGLTNDGAAETKGGVPYNKYGYMLAEAALLNLESGKGSTTPCSVGSIHSQQIAKYTVDKQVFTDAEKEAAKSIGTTYEDAEAENYPYEYNGGVINSKYHWNKVYQQVKQDEAGTFKATTTIEINVLMIGTDTAFVVAPTELFDRYDANQSTADADNDWNTLVDTSLLGTASYGTPFILGYTNGHLGYIPNTMAYHYNEGDEYTGYNLVGTGSYEANTTVYAEGTGEELIVQYASMLKLLAEGTLEKVCPHCGVEVEWTPLTNDTYAATWEANGHYYLAEDIEESTANYHKFGSDGDTLYSADGTFCLDLNGHSVDVTGRSFLVYGPCSLNLFDSVGTGAVTSHSINAGNNPNGGVISLSGSTATFNLYGGTLQLEQASDAYTNRGGIVALGSGTMNMYGGTVKGATLLDGYAITDRNCGAAIYAGGGSKLNVYGGTIEAGSIDTDTTNSTDGAGNCVYVASSTTNVVTLSGDAHVDEIYYENVTGANLVVENSFTGYAKLHYNSSNVTLTDGLDIGNSSNASFHQAAFDVWTSATNGYTSAQECDKSYVDVDGTDIKYFLNPVAQIVTASGAKNYSAIADALNDYSEGYIKLLESIDTLTVSKNLTLDLNGYSVQNLAAEGYTVSCMDAATADYTVEDGNGYGKIVSYTGTVVGADASVDGVNAWLKVSETEGTSFHAVDLQVKTLSLRTKVTASGETKDTVAMYYKSDFYGDEIVEQKVKSFGVALSVTAVPTSANLTTACKRSVFTGFNGGTAGNAGTTGTVLYDIMQTGNSYMTNRSNSTMPIYGRNYIETDDGYLFGVAVDYSLADALELYDDQLVKTLSDVPESIQGWYTTYNSVMRSWDIPYIRNAKTRANAFTEDTASGDDGVVRILGIGNSFTIDCMKPLYNIIKAETGKEVSLGILYYSGCTLAQHVSFYENKEAKYQFYECSSETGGEWVITGKLDDAYTDCYSLVDGLNDQKWDIVTMQQGVKQAAKAETYNDDIGTIRDVVTTTLGYEPEFVWNMTWSLPEDADEPNGVLKDYPLNSDSYNYYDNFIEEFGSNENMYKMIASAVQSKIVLGDYDWDYIIPVGTAVQNAKSTGLEYVDLYADYCHLRSLGSIIASYTWYCRLAGITELYEINVTELEAALIRDTIKTGENTYEAVGDVTFTEEQLQIILEAVNGALANPYSVTAAQ